MKNKATTFLLQSSFENNKSSFSKNHKVNFVSVLVLVLFSLLWTLTLLTLSSLYKNYKRSLKLNRRVKAKYSSEKQRTLFLIFMVVAFSFSMCPTVYNLVILYATKIDNVESKNNSRINAFVPFLFLFTISI